jgi:hypothetical protein
MTRKIAVLVLFQLFALSCAVVGQTAPAAIDWKAVEHKAAITDDFVLLAGEVNPVIKAVRQNGIQVTALHNHMVQEEPRLFFVHFWAIDDAVKLAKGLRAALDNTKPLTKVSFPRFVGYFLGLGTVGFGGPLRHCEKFLNIRSADTSARHV